MGSSKPGQLGIVSTLSIAGAAEYGGTPTTRIVKSVVAGGRRTATSSVVQQTDGGATPSEPVPDSNERARLTYEDEQGRHVFSMRKDALSIGRGGSSAWVDVQVVTTAKVSREHFRLRRDDSGRFFIQDVSLWGTSVDGEPMPPAIKSPEGVAAAGSRTGAAAERPNRPRRRAGNAVRSGSPAMTWLYWLHAVFLFASVATLGWLLYLRETERP